MIYLIESGEYYKIGYAQNVDDRMKTYNTHNPNYKLIDAMPGTRSDEAVLHELCAEYQNKLEWFNKVPEILTIWKIYKKTSQIKYEKMQIFNKDIKYIQKQIQFITTHLENIYKATDKAEFLCRCQFSIDNLYNELTQNICRKKAKSNFKKLSRISMEYIEPKRKHLPLISPPAGEFSYKELKELYEPIFIEKGIHWSQKSIAKYFPNCRKKRKQINGIQSMYYIFE